MAHPRDVRIAELKAQIESAKAEIKQLEADVQAEVAEDSQLDGTLMNRNTDAAIAAYEADKKNNELLVDTKSTGLGLDGNRNDQGDFIEAQTYREMTADEQKLYDAIMADDWDGTLTDELQLIANGMSDDDFIDTGIPFVQKKVFTIDDTEDGKGKGMNFKAAAEDTEPKMAEKEKGSGMDLTGQNEKDIDLITEKQIADPDLGSMGEPEYGKTHVMPDGEVMLDEDMRTDEESGKMRHGGVDAEEGRNKPEESNARGEKAGWSMEEGSNMWSVDEKDPYWKTQEGFDEAMDLYGKKPSWVKEPTLIWNPETQEYEEVEPEEFEDLSRPSISADIKKLFG
tara:strand:+ start:694 stop:1713 length:1020 start_codon:yes stop_codon:yes gene_type:complete